LRRRKRWCSTKRKSEENEWNWERRKIEQVNEFKYLDSTKEPRIKDISEK
jgi:hypothetical protein